MGKEGHWKSFKRDLRDEKQGSLEGCVCVQHAKVWGSVLVRSLGLLSQFMETHEAAKAQGIRSAGLSLVLGKVMEQIILSDVMQGITWQTGDQAQLACVYERQVLLDHLP